MFVILRARSEVKKFWNKHRKTFLFAARGASLIKGQTFLNDDEWVFASTKVGLIKTVARWTQLGIKCEWYNWRKKEPNMWEEWARDRKDHSEDIYDGFWKIQGLPGIEEDWFCGEYTEITDPNLSQEKVCTMLLEQLFDDWMENHCIEEIFLYDATGLDEFIKSRAP